MASPAKQVDFGLGPYSPKKFPILVAQLHESYALEDWKNRFRLGRLKKKTIHIPLIFHQFPDAPMYETYANPVPWAWEATLAYISRYVGSVVKFWLHPKTYEFRDLPITSEMVREHRPINPVNPIPPRSYLVPLPWNLQQSHHMTKVH